MVALMAMLIVIVAAIGWSIQRTLFASKAVDLRIQSYRDHHEVQGLKAIVARWFSAPETRKALSEKPDAASGPLAPPEYHAKLPNDTVIRLRLVNGQGTILARLDNVPSIQVQELLLSALREIPVDRDDLIRRHGPATTCLAAAPAEVLLALAGGDPGLAEVLTQMQADPPRDAGEMVRRIMDAGFTETQGRELTLVLTLQPTLSRVDAEVTDEFGTRRYALLVGEQDGLPSIYECRRLVGREEALAVSASAR
jgi:hypothetical protein